MDPEGKERTKKKKRKSQLSELLEPYKTTYGEVLSIYKKEVKQDGTESPSQANSKRRRVEVKEKRVYVLVSVQSRRHGRREEEKNETS